MAWLLPPEWDETQPEEPSISTLNYWISRLQPLVDDSKTRTVVVCNRTGEEEGAQYAGTSCVLQFGGGEVIVLGMLGREEGVLYIDFEL
jgi:protein N-terminal amidase